MPKDRVPKDSRGANPSALAARSLLASMAIGVLAVGVPRVAVAEAGVWTSLPPAEPYAKERVREILSDAFKVDRIFKSMLGPVTTRTIRVLDTEEPELLWMTGYEMDVVGEDGVTPESAEFECHTNLAWPREQPPRGLNRPVARAFTLTQGQTELRLPRGFGMPVLSNELLTFNSQVLNLSRPNANFSVRHRTRIRYLRDVDLSEPMRPLVSVVAQAMVTLEETPQRFDVADAQADEHLAGASCHVGDYAGQWKGGIFTDKHDRRFTPHWVVPPGRHEYRTVVTENMRIPYTTTVHFVGVHVHPNSVSLELRDLTAGKTLFKSHQANHDERAGLKWADYYASEKGFLVYKDHEYELISVYNNETDEDTDAMAGMFIYYLNRAYRHPLKNRSAAPASS